MCEETRLSAVSFADAIVRDERIAGVFASAAFEMEATGSKHGAEHMRSVCRHHRIKALENLGRLAALNRGARW